MSELTKTYISLQSLQHLLISCRHLNSILIQKENYFLNSTFWLAMCWYPAWSFWKTCACRRSSMSSERADGSSHCWDSHWGRQQCPCPNLAQPQLSSLRVSSCSSWVWTEHYQNAGTASTFAVVLLLIFQHYMQKWPRAEISLQYWFVLPRYYSFPPCFHSTWVPQWLMAL